MKTPKTYLTRHEDGRFTLFDGGSPLTAPVAREAAEREALRLKIRLPLPVWDAEAGRFESQLEVEWAAAARAAEAAGHGLSLADVDAALAKWEAASDAGDAGIVRTSMIAALRNERRRLTAPASGVPSEEVQRGA